jgi:hypothetical protein
MQLYLFKRYNLSIFELKTTATMKTKLVFLFLLLTIAVTAQKKKGEVKSVDFGNDLLIEKPLPPLLFASDIAFIDENNNNRIDANESCKITFKISNK